jgi:hypothetical protein
MAQATVRHDFRPRALQAIINDPNGGHTRDMARRSQRVRTAAQRLAGSATGRLRSSIAVDLVSRNGGVGARVGNRLPYAGVHHTGRGPVTPTRPGGVLRFTANGRVVFARRVRAVPPNRYLRDALPAARD